MKKIIMCLAVSTMLLAGCEKAVPDSPATEPEKPMKVLNEQTGMTMLSFGSEADMFVYIDALKSMLPEEKEAWYQKNDMFESQDEFRWKVAEELDGATSIDQAREIQSKYKPYLLFNEQPLPDGSYDISPYLPNDGGGIEMVCNRHGDVQIGGQIRNFNTLDSYENTRSCILSKENRMVQAAEYRVNRISKSTSGYKFWIDAMLNTSTGWIEIQMEAQRKILGMWNIYQTTYYLKLTEIENWEVWGPFAERVNRNSSSTTYFSTGKIKANTQYKFVSGVRNPWRLNPTASFTLVGHTSEIKTDGSMTVKASTEFTPYEPVNPGGGTGEPIIGGDIGVIEWPY